MKTTGPVSLPVMSFCTLHSTDPRDVSPYSCIRLDYHNLNHKGDEVLFHLSRTHVIRTSLRKFDNSSYSVQHELFHFIIEYLGAVASLMYGVYCCHRTAPCNWPSIFSIFLCPLAKPSRRHRTNIFLPSLGSKRTSQDAPRAEYYQPCTILSGTNFWLSLSFLHDIPTLRVLRWNILSSDDIAMTLSLG